MRVKILMGVSLVLGGSLFLPSLQAADFEAEVMTLKGSAQLKRADALEAPLKQGDLLRSGDRIEVLGDSYVDVAYDKEWHNVTRLGANSRTTIQSIFPTGLKIDRGELFAKLKKLPKATTFEVQTPTAVAAVRGTEFLVEVDDKGATKVLGLVNEVEVFSLDASGGLGERVVVTEDQKTEVGAVDEPPSVPEKISDEDMKRLEAMSGGVQEAVEDWVKEGREGQTQAVGSVEAMKFLGDFYGAKGPADGPGGPDGPGESELSPEQMEALKKQFIEMGGDPGEFDQFKQYFTAVDPESFDKLYESFESGDYSMTNPPPPDYSTTDSTMPEGDFKTDGTMREPDDPKFPGAGDFKAPDDSTMPPPPDFTPPDMGAIEQNIQQTEQQLQQTIDQTTHNLPPPPDDDPCLRDPSKCLGSPTYT